MGTVNKKEMIAGSGGKGGGGGGGGIELPDSLRSISVAKVLDLICEGPIQGLVDGARSIYLNETPLEVVNSSGVVVKNFKNVTWEQRLGTIDQTYIPKFAASESEINVNTRIKQDTPITRAITNTALDAVRVTIAVPALSFQDMTTGNIYGATASIQIAVSNNGGAYINQIIGYEWVTDGVTVSEDQKTMTHETAAQALQFTVSGQCPFWWLLEQQDSYLSFTVRYRLVGESTWTTYKVEKIEPRKAIIYNRTYQITGLPLGLYEVNVTDIHGGTANLSGCKTGTETDHDSIIGKTLSRYQRSYRIELPAPGPWQIKVSRITADSTAANVQNQTWWESYTEIIDAKFRYPHSALVAITADASQFNSIPQRAYDMYLKIVQVPNNYDPITKTYTGIWDGTFKLAWTDNPAWCFYDLLTNERYGMGKYIPEALVDKWTLYSIGQYCDGLVPSGYKRDGVEVYEPRFTLNCYIQTRAEAYRVIQDLAAVFRGMAYWAEGMITSTQDAPGTVSKIFSPANVIDGMFNYTGSAKRARHTVALVTWNDPENFFRQTVEYVEDREGIDRFGINETQVVAFGCTSRGQAARVGRWILYSERYETDIVTFRTGLEGCYVRPGSLIQIADPCRGANRKGGRITSVVEDATTTTIGLDRPVTLLLGIEYTLSCVLSDGSLESLTVTTGASTTSTLVLDGKFTTAPINGGMWLLNSDDEEPALYRVLVISEPEPMVVEITALEHDPNKYDYIEYGLSLDEPYPDLPPGYLLPPTELEVTQTWTTSGSGNWDMGITAVVHWEKSPDPRTTQYKVKWRRENDNWSEGYTQTNEFNIPNVIAGVYDFAVMAMGYNNLLSEEVALLDEVIDGITGHPPDVTGLDTTYGGGQFPGNDCQVVWDSMLSADFPRAFFKFYKVEVYDTETVPNLRRTEYVASPEYTYTYGKNLEDSEKLLPGGNALYTFEIRVTILDVAGDESENYASVICTQSGVEDESLSDVYLTALGIGTGVQLEVHGIQPSTVALAQIYVSSVNNIANAAYLATMSNLHYTHLVTSGVRYYWVKIFRTLGASTYDSVSVSYWVPDTTAGVMGTPFEPADGNHKHYASEIVLVV